MGLERLLARLGRAVVVILVVAGGYVAFGILLALVPGVEPARPSAMPWPEFLPMWLLGALLLVALAASLLYTMLLMVLRRRKRKLVAALSAEAAAWQEGSVARAAALTGVKLTRVGGFRAHARTPHVVELSWNPPLDGVGEVVVQRSATGFSTSAEAGGDQEVVCRTVESTYVDADLEDERVYFYTAFARGNDGSWSSPSWAWAATPRLPLHSTVMGSVRTLRTGMIDD